MNRMLLGASFASAALATSVWAQSSGPMHDNHAMNKDMAPMTANTTYVGCVESVNHGARFVLTHVADGAAMNDTKKKSDMKMASMKHDDMKDMKHDEMKDMKHDDMKAADNGMAMMTPASLALQTTSVDLRKHVGHKVSVTGSRVESEGGSDMTPTFTVTAVKVVAKTCR